MLSIVNKTGMANTTKIYDKNGNDITSLLSCYKIEIDISVGEQISANLHCRVSKIESKHIITNIKNEREMESNGLGRIN